MTGSVALRLVLPNHLADVWLVDTVGLVALAGAPAPQTYPNSRSQGFSG